MRRGFRWAAALTVVPVLAAVGLSGLELSGSSNATLQLSSQRAGRSAAHRLTFDVQAGAPEIHRAVVTYPDGFRFNGFHVVGPVGSTVGAYELDLNFDGVAERTLNLKSLGPDIAFIDLIADGAFSPGAEPVIRGGAGSTLELRLPFGGDANSNTVVVPFAARITLLLVAGLIVNPPAGGLYDVTAEFTTVDPDTDEESDGAGATPGVSRVTLPVRIDGPSIETFAHLVVGKFDLRRDAHGRYRFTIHGRFVPGPSSDGVNVAAENTTVALDWFRQTVPGSAFKRPVRATTTR